MTKTVSEMKGPELVAEYNRLSVAAGLKPIKRFASQKDALKRIAKLAGKPAKDAKKVRAPKAAKEDKRSKSSIEFGCRFGSKSEKLVLFFRDDHYRNMVPVGDVLQKMYGSKNVENKGALQMRLSWIDKTIAELKLPYELRRAKGESKEMEIGLYPKG